MHATTPPEQTDAVESESTATAHQPPDEPSAPAGRPVAESEDAAGDLSLDLAFEILKNERRRRVLEHVRAADGELTLGELAERIAAQENDTTVHALTSAERKRVYVGLYQCHLPKMADAGVIDYNADRGLVERGDNAAALEHYLDAVTTRERPWYRYYGVISAAGIGLLAGSGLGYLPLAPVVGVVFTLLLGCAGLHAIESRATASD